MYECMSTRTCVCVWHAYTCTDNLQKDTQETGNTGLPLGEEKGWLGYMNWMEIFVSFEFRIANVLPVK